MTALTTGRPNKTSTMNSDSINDRTGETTVVTALHSKGRSYGSLHDNSDSYVIRTPIATTDGRHISIGESSCQDGSARQEEEHAEDRSIVGKIKRHLFASASSGNGDTPRSTPPISPPASPLPPHQLHRHPPRAPHLGRSRQYWRDIILGVNDGLVSTFLLVAGVAGGGLSMQDILLTAIAGALAGAVSMCAGEFVATKSQNEVLQGEIQLEREHVRDNLDDEVEELDELLKIIGICPPESPDHAAIRNELCQFYQSHPDSLVRIMTALEFGLVEEQERSPVWAGLTSCLLFFMGSLPSVLPFVYSSDTYTPTMGLIVAAILTVFALLLVGAIKTWATRGNCLRASIENLVIAGFGGGLAYGVGRFFDAVLHD